MQPRNCCHMLEPWQCQRVTGRWGRRAWGRAGTSQSCATARGRSSTALRRAGSAAAGGGGTSRVRFGSRGSGTGNSGGCGNTGLRLRGGTHVYAGRATGASPGRRRPQRDPAPRCGSRLHTEGGRGDGNANCNSAQSARCAAGKLGTGAISNNVLQGRAWVVVRGLR